MTLAQSLTAIIIFWAIVGGLGASLLLPAMQSLIHGNFEGAAQRKVYALVGAAAAIAAAVGPLIGGFITTFLSWRVAFAARGRDHRGRAVGHQARQGRALHRVRGRSTSSGRSSRSWAWAGSCWASWRGRRAAEAVGALLVGRRVRDGGLRLLAGAAQAPGQGDADRPGLFASKMFRIGISEQMLQQIALGGTMIALPIYLQMVLEYNAHGGRPVACPALAEHVRHRAARGQEGRQPAPRQHHPARVRAAHRSGCWCCSRSCPARTRAGTSWSRW